MTNKFAWFSVAGTILLTIGGQFLIKWRVGGLTMPASLGGKILVLLQQFTDPWIMGAMISAFVASMFWMSAMTRLPLSVAYPFTSLSFVIVALLSAVFMHEPVTIAKASGVLLVVAGLTILARG